MEQQMTQLTAQITMLRDQMQQQITDFTGRIAMLEQQNAPQELVLYDEVKLNITDPKDIDLGLFKSLPKFDGDKDQYRSWRSQVWTFMEAIKTFQNHPKYYSALGIMRTKITGPAANILTNHNTKLNFYSIINRLDYTYADQRPLYVLLDELKKITQGRKTLAEFHSEVSKALNLALSKIEMSSDDNSEGMKTYANQEAVRTFILGLNSKYTSGTLYSHNPGNLESAYATACTISHDNVNEEFETQFRPLNQRQHYSNQNRHNYPQPHKEEREYKPNIRIQRSNYQPRNFYQQQQQQPPQQQQPTPIPMDVDHSRQYMQTTRYNNAVSRNHFKPNNAYKRDRASNYNNTTSMQDRKFQRINQLNREDLESVDVSNYEEQYETGSTFLGE